jgi:hypothetical protein
MIYELGEPIKLGNTAICVNNGAGHWRGLMVIAAGLDSWRHQQHQQPETTATSSER